MTRYAAIEGAVGMWRDVAPVVNTEGARASLAARLADLRSRHVAYRIFPSPLGPS